MIKKQLIQREELKEILKNYILPKKYADAGGYYNGQEVDNFVLGDDYKGNEHKHKDTVIFIINCLADEDDRYTAVLKNNKHLTFTSDESLYLYDEEVSLAYDNGSLYAPYL